MTIHISHIIRDVDGMVQVFGKEYHQCAPSIYVHLIRGSASRALEQQQQHKLLMNERTVIIDRIMCVRWDVSVVDMTWPSIFFHEQRRKKKKEKKKWDEVNEINIYLYL